MLVQKQNEEPLTLKILLLGTMLVFIFFLIKYLRRMSKTTHDIQDPHIAKSIPCVGKSRAPSPHRTTIRSSEDKRSRRTQGRQRHARFYEEWLPKQGIETCKLK